MVTIPSGAQRLLITLDHGGFRIENLNVNEFKKFHAFMQSGGLSSRSRNPVSGVSRASSSEASCIIS